MAQAPDGMTDEERDQLFAGLYRQPRIPTAAGVPPAQTPEFASAGQTLPTITPGPHEPRPPAGTIEDTRRQLADVQWQREHPLGSPGSRMPGTGGKILHGLAKAGEIAADVLDPGLLATIPGTPEHRGFKEAWLTKTLGEQEREQSEAGLRSATAEKEKAETAALGQPKLRELTGTNAQTPTGYQRWYDETSKHSFWVGPNEQPLDVLRAQLQEEKEAGTLQGTGAPPTEPGAPGALPRVQTPAAQPPPPMAAPTPAPAPEKKRRPGQLPEGSTFGAPKTMSGEQQVKEDFLKASQIPAEQRTPEQQQLIDQHQGEWGKLVAGTQADIDNAVKGMNDRYEHFRTVVGPSMPHPPGIAKGESMEDIEKKQANYEKLIADEVDRKQRELDAQPGKDIALQMKKEQLDKLKREQDQEAFVGYGNLYAQDNYSRAMQAWHKSPSYDKDLGFINSIVNEAKTQLPSSPGLSTTAGALIGSVVGGPGGAAAGTLITGAAGAASSVFASIINPIANGYLDAARKRGISPEGYNAMQAYFNALPGRMAYEMSTQGIKASTMRSSQLLAKVMQTVPAPDTPRDVFSRAFTQYYNPMKALTDHKYKREGFTPPPYEAIYGAEEQQQKQGVTPPPNAKIRKFNPSTGRFE